MQMSRWRSKFQESFQKEKLLTFPSRVNQSLPLDFPVQIFVLLSSCLKSPEALDWVVKLKLTWTLLGANMIWTDVSLFLVFSIFCVNIHRFPEELSACLLIECCFRQRVWYIMSYKHCITFSKNWKVLDSKTNLMWRFQIDYGPALNHGIVMLTCHPYRFWTSGKETYFTFVSPIPCEE